MDVLPGLCLAAIALVYLPAPVYAGATASPEVISKWILHSEPTEEMGEPIPGKTVFRTFRVKGRILTYLEEAYNEDDAARPSKDTYTVALANVARFSKDEYKWKGRILHVIGIETKGDQDITYVFGRGFSGKHGSFAGLAQFAPAQEALRDAVYEKLCALIGQAP